MFSVKEAAKILEEVYKLDQTARDKRKDIEEIDSSNLKKVEKILNKFGWLSSKIVGSKANTALFLVIQHADLQTQLKYLPTLQEAVKLGNAQASHLALLQDRIAVRQNKKQIYGTQIGKDNTGKYYLLDLIEPSKVNKRRESVGLKPLEEYLKKWNINN